jgi:uncharacterized paraquat-inducible protein A
MSWYGEPLGPPPARSGGSCHCGQALEDHDGDCCPRCGTRLGRRGVWERRGLTLPRA